MTAHLMVEVGQGLEDQAARLLHHKLDTKTFELQNTKRDFQQLIINHSLQTQTDKDTDWLIRK